MSIDPASTDSLPFGHAVLALELKPMHVADRLVIERSVASELTDAIGADLARLVPQLAGHGLAVLAAHFDPAELLRPGWPIHSLLRAVLHGAPAGRGLREVLAVAGQGGRLPAEFSPDANLVGGPLRLVPITVAVSEPVRAEVHADLEAILLESGMAGAATALSAQRLFGVPIEHARYLSLSDLLALIAVQYQHAGLEPLWPLIETALLEPDAVCWLDAAPEPLLRCAGGVVSMAVMSADVWSALWADPAATPGSERGQADYRHFCNRSRQIAAVLRAHGIELRELPCRAGQDPRQVLVSD